jgi:hypothetical protein
MRFSWDLLVAEPLAAREQLLARQATFALPPCAFRPKADTDARGGNPWGWHSLTDIHQEAFSARKDAHHGDHEAQQAP